MPREVHLSSLVVHARPERVDEVAQRLAGMGCEVHLTTEAGKLVVTLETDDGRVLGDTVTAMQRLDHVLAATLVFHHCEPAPEGDGAVPAKEERQSEVGS